ncbi:MAG: amidohydrolase family protein [Acidobacteriota bacterium]
MPPGGVRGGIFLHAPYSVSTELRDRARDFARKQRLLLATHLFESREEIELLTHGTGALFAAIDAMGMARFLAAPSTIADAITCHAIEGTLLIHLASLAPDDAARLPSGAIAVLCPRSNQNLGVGPAPHEALRRAGVVLALGTDSRATVSNLDMRDEMRAACDAYGIAPVEAFAMATLGGAAAAADPSLGRIGAGDTATFMAVNDDGCADVFEALLGSGAVSSLWLGGQPWVKA